MKKLNIRKLLADIYGDVGTTNNVEAINIDGIYNLWNILKIAEYKPENQRTPFERFNSKINKY